MGKINLLVITGLKNLNANDYTVLDLPITQPVKSVSVDLKKANSSDTFRLQILESSSTKARVYNYTSDTGNLNIQSFVVWISAV